MDTNKCYIVDCGREMFMWVGRDTQLDERKAAAFIVQVKYHLCLCCTLKFRKPSLLSVFLVIKVNLF